MTPAKQSKTYEKGRLEREKLKEEQADTVSEGRAAIGSVRHHIEGGWVHGERAGHHTDALGQWFRV